MNDNCEMPADGLGESAGSAQGRERVKSAVNEVLASAMAARAVEDVIAKSIKRLKGLPSDMSGEDSGLGTVWREYCAQVQGEQSFAWGHYEDLVRETVRASVEELAQFERQAAWLDTPEGRNWLDEPGSNPAEVPVSVEDLVNEIYDAVWQRAADWEDARLDHYLHRGGGRDDDGDDEGELDMGEPDGDGDGDGDGRR